MNPDGLAIIGPITAIVDAALLTHLNWRRGGPHSPGLPEDDE